MDSQRLLLQGWRIPIRQIGYEVGRKGMADEEIIPFLLGLRNPTLFTFDLDFFLRNFCHPRYCLVCLDVAEYEGAKFVRRVLRHPLLDTQAKRSGLVVRATHTGLRLWRPHAMKEASIRWQD